LGDVAPRDMALEVLTSLVTPTVCYHNYIERYFNPNSNPSLTCNNCSVCLRETSSFTGLVHKAQLQSFLTTTFLAGSETVVTALLPKIRAAKAVLFHEEHVPGDLDAAPIHALGLQLIASRMLVFHGKQYHSLLFVKYRSIKLLFFLTRIVAVINSEG
jgi:hypothetical protein